MFKCDLCSYVSSNKSGFTRNKCQNGSNSSKNSSASDKSQQILVKCDLCEKVCVSVSGLKRHKNLKHGKDRGNNTKDGVENSSVKDSSKIVTIVESVQESSEPDISSTSTGGSSIRDKAQSNHDVINQLKRSTRSRKAKLASQ